MPPEPLPSESKMIFWRKALLVSIALVVIPPLFGMGVTATGMLRAFNEIETDTSELRNSEALAENISFAMRATAIGLVISFFGIIAFVFCLIRFLNLTSRTNSTS